MLVPLQTSGLDLRLRRSSTAAACADPGGRVPRYRSPATNDSQLSEQLAASEGDLGLRLVLSEPADKRRLQHAILARRAAAMLNYDDLSEPECLLWDAIEVGALIDLQPGATDRDGAENGSTWGTERTVPAQLLIELMTVERRPGAERPRALRLRGARIAGALDLEALTLSAARWHLRTASSMGPSH